jgi:hypothetical protein
MMPLSVKTEHLSAGEPQSRSRLLAFEITAGELRNLTLAALASRRSTVC